MKLKQINQKFIKSPYSVLIHIDHPGLCQGFTEVQVSLAIRGGLRSL